VLLESGLAACLPWLEKKLEQLQLQAHQLAYKKKSYRGEATVLQYLLPCYLSLLGNTELGGRGLLFLYQVLRQMLLHYGKLLNETPTHLDEISDLKRARKTTWMDQNKVKSY